MNYYQVIKTVSVTEKSNGLLTQNKYTFLVHPNAGKEEVRAAVEALFDRKVSKVNVMNRQGKKRRNKFGLGRTASTKRAIVTLRAGEEAIELF
jgi:large subunit ribosomal protein L23